MSASFNLKCKNLNYRNGWKLIRDQRCRSIGSFAIAQCFPFKQWQLADAAQRFTFIAEEFGLSINRRGQRKEGWEHSGFIPAVPTPAPYPPCSRVKDIGRVFTF